MRNSILFSVITFFATQAISQTIIPAAQLQEDFAILKQAFTSLHPGLYRYNDSLQMEAHFNTLNNQLSRDLTRPEAYLAFSWFTASIKCGHTYCNFWNQPAEIQQELFQQEDKLPFTFRLIDRRMLVVKNCSMDERLRQGVEILAIDGVPVGEMLDSLSLLVKSDGSNDSKRYKDLELSQTGIYESFDVYQPLLFPPKNGRFEIAAVDLKAGENFSATVLPVNRAQRYERMTKRFGEMGQTPDDLWEFKLLDDKTGYLHLGTFETWTMKMDWKKFLAESFKTLKDKQIPNLIIDIRENEGGMDEVNAELAKHLATKPIALPASRSLLKFEKVPDPLRPYLGTWDEGFYDFSGQVRPAGNGYFTPKKDHGDSSTFPMNRKAYQGKIWLMVSPTNSSATFFLARVLRENGMATLVGQETGGNLKGINGGAIFFLTLPHSKVEMDIPIYATFYDVEQPDSGLMPDVYVKPDVEDVLNGVDTELEKVKSLIVENQ